MPNPPLSPRRVIVKISGEALMGEKPFGIDPTQCARLVGEIAPALAAGFQIGVVVGGGNIFRGVAPAAAGMDRAQADYIGMLATVMNGLALADAFKTASVDARVLSALPMDAVAERYGREKAMEHLERGRVAIFVAGTGNPFFTADTAAALRAAEVGADAVLRSDPRGRLDDPSRPGRKIDSIEYGAAMERGISPCDATAFALLRERGVPLCSLSLFERGALLRALRGEPEGSWFLPA